MWHYQKFSRRIGGEVVREAWNYQVGALLYCPANNQSLGKNIIQSAFGDKFSLCFSRRIGGEVVREAWNYQVGALLYCPANNQSLGKNIIQSAFGDKFSLCLCLEDTINDKKVREAELDMEHTLRQIYEARRAGKQFYLPKIFIRVRQKEQIVRLIEELGNAADIVVGFNLPKFNLENAPGYLEELNRCKAIKRDIKFMPILESEDLANVMKRPQFLYDLKMMLKPYEDMIVNIRVGGNDLSHIYGLRRHSTETIYDIKPVIAALTDILQVFGTEYVVSGPVFEYYNGENWAEGLQRECAKDVISGFVGAALTDILQVFGTEYVVSGPVFEYYNGENWAEGLQRECAKDVISGFVGKTAIHPKQIAIINDALKVFKEDYDDAKEILNWDDHESSYVKGNVTGSRMNEVKTHLNWANRIMALADYYGIK